MKGKRLFKFGLMLVLVCLVLGMASMAMAFSISGVKVNSIDDAGNVDITATLSGVASGDQVTIKVEDYSLEAPESIKYIDQVSYASGDAVNFSFKLKDVEASVSKTYKLSIGGTGVSTARAEALFKPATGEDSPYLKMDTAPAAIIVGGPFAIQKTNSSSETYYARVVNSNGEYLPDASVVWSFNEGTLAGLSISNGVVTVDTASSVTVSQLTVKATSSSNGAVIGTMLVNVVDTKTTNDSDIKTAIESGITVGSSTLVFNEKFSGNFAAKRPIPVGETITFNLPTVVGTPTVTIYKPDGTLAYSGNSNTFSTNISTAGRYKIVYAGADFKKVMYFGVAPVTVANIFKRSEIEAGDTIFANTDISLTKDVNGKLQIQLFSGVDQANTKYKYFILDKQYVSNSASKWIVLSDWTAEETITVALPPDGEYFISVYAKNDYSGEYVDAHRLKTLTVSGGAITQ